MGGFIGSTEDGVTTTLGRGGSDFTASIVGRGHRRRRDPDLDRRRRHAHRRPDHPARRPSRQDHLVRRSRRAGLLRRQGAASGHRGSGHREEHSGADSEFAPARSARHAHRRRGRALRQRGEVDRLQAQDHAGQHPLHAHADGARISAPHLRSLRPLRDAGGYGGDFRGQRLAHHRQSVERLDAIQSRAAPVRRGRDGKEPGDRLPGGREYPLHAGRGAPRLQRARRHQYPHDFARRVAAESQLRGRRGRPSAQPSKRCTTNSSPSSIRTSSNATRPCMPNVSPLSATARWAS